MNAMATPRLANSHKNTTARWHEIGKYAAEKRPGDTRQTPHGPDKAKGGRPTPEREACTTGSRLRPRTSRRCRLQRERDR